MSYRTNYGYLHNRRIVIRRSYQNAWDQRFESAWTNPYGTDSFEDYHCFWITALLGAIARKVSGEIGAWRQAQPDKTWRLP